MAKLQVYTVLHRESGKEHIVKLQQRTIDKSDEHITNIIAYKLFGKNTNFKCCRMGMDKNYNESYIGHFEHIEFGNGHEITGLCLITKNVRGIQE
jgi:hypothetical protein